ncbi:MAG: hypothetical protein LJE84_01500 [Gammaproteobacteria bacterium]|nr:hypothetical protein [Gammaproteobacteria bacterium]
MKPVIQREPTGCGIASVAAIAGLSYGKARSIAAGLGIHAGDPRLWSQTVPVRTLLGHLGIRTGSRTIPFRSWQGLPDLALLAIKWHRESGTPHWHWVVFVREEAGACVLDSRKGLGSNRRTDFGRMRPKWYLPVLRAKP